MIDMLVKRPTGFFPPSFLLHFSHSLGLLLSSALAFLPLRVSPLSSLHRKLNGFIFCDCSVFYCLIPSPLIVFLSFSWASELLALGSHQVGS